MEEKIREAFNAGYVASFNDQTTICICCTEEPELNAARDAAWEAHKATLLTP